MKKLNRREFLGLTVGGLTLAGCGRRLEKRVELPKIDDFIT